MQRCVVCKRRIWPWQEKVELPRAAKALNVFLHENEAMHVGCALTILLEILDEVKLSINAINGYLGIKEVKQE